MITGLGACHLADVIVVDGGVIQVAAVDFPDGSISGQGKGVADHVTILRAIVFELGGKPLHGSRVEVAQESVMSGEVAVQKVAALEGEIVEPVQALQQQGEQPRQPGCLVAGEAQFGMGAGQWDDQ